MWEADPGRFAGTVPALVTMGARRGRDGEGRLVVRHALSVVHHGVDGVLPVSVVAASVDSALVGVSTDALTDERMCVTTSLSLELLVDDLGSRDLEVATVGELVGRHGDAYVSRGECRAWDDGRLLAIGTMWSQAVDVALYSVADAPAPQSHTDADGLRDLLGVEGSETLEGGARVHADIALSMVNAAGQTHGLVPPMLSELAVRAALPDAAPRLLALRSDYGRPLPAGPISCTAQVVRRGRTSARLLTTCAGPDGRPCVEAVVTCAL